MATNVTGLGGSPVPYLTQEWIWLARTIEDPSWVFDAILKTPLTSPSIVSIATKQPNTPFNAGWVDGRYDPHTINDHTFNDGETKSLNDDLFTVKSWLDPHNPNWTKECQPKTVRFFQQVSYDRDDLLEFKDGGVDIQETIKAGLQRRLEWMIARTIFSTWNNHLIGKGEFNSMDTVYSDISPGPIWGKDNSDIARAFATDPYKLDRLIDSAVGFSTPSTTSLERHQKDLTMYLSPNAWTIAMADVWLNSKTRQELYTPIVPLPAETISSACSAWDVANIVRTDFMGISNNRYMLGDLGSFLLFGSNPTKDNPSGLRFDFVEDFDPTTNRTTARTTVKFIGTPIRRAYVSGSLV